MPIAVRGTYDDPQAGVDSVELAKRILGAPLNIVGGAVEGVGGVVGGVVGGALGIITGGSRITSYNVGYTKLLREEVGLAAQAAQVVDEGPHAGRVLV